MLNKLAILACVASLAACGGGSSGGTSTSTSAPSGGGAQLQMLTVTDSGSGTVTSNPAGISCGSGSCSAGFAGGTSVTLTAQPAAGYSFAGWGGACSGTGNCNITMSKTELATASFASTAGTDYLLTLTESGSGTVTSNPAGINCNSSCSATFASATAVTLTAQAASGYTFAGWGGACSGTGSCVVTMNSALSVDATFNSSSGTSVYATVADATLGVGGSLNGDIPFPADNAWNTDISDPVAYPVDPNSANLISSIGTGTGLHPDFGPSPYGIPYVVVDSTQPNVPISINASTGYPSDSDIFPMPIPPNAPVENGSDAHVIVVDRSTSQLFELYHAAATANPLVNGWTADGSAAFDLTSDNVRPTKAGQCDVSSADAAGLPIFPGLARYDEVASGVIRHALRFTVASSRAAFVPPANHWASSSTSVNLPPMGMRVRLKAGYAIPSSFSQESRVILQAMKTYGMIVADNGSSWFISGATDFRWPISMMVAELSQVQGSNFEVVQMVGLKTSCP
jgi:hypothetical protein